MKISDLIRKDFDPRLLQTSEGRKALTKHDPLLFAAVYMPHKLRENETDDISLNPFHMDVIEYAKSWTRPLDIKNPNHDCFISPRQCGKSTWIGHILPIWAGAFMHKRYLIFFSDSDTQARGWLLNFKSELASNEYLREDFPEFCDVKRLTERAKAFEDNANRTQRGNGFVFHVAGADSGVLGANVGGVRPEIILFDDIEPDMAKYSVLEAAKRLQTLLTSHFYLNTAAVKAFIGTTTMPDSIIDQMRKVREVQVNYESDCAEDGIVPDKDGLRQLVEPDMRWVVDKGIKVHYWPAILTDNENVESSLWPEKWTLEYLKDQEGTRDFQMNMMNRPVGLGAGYWEDDDIRVSEPMEYGNTLISIDPAVKKKKTNDYTGIVVASRGNDGNIYIRHAEQTRKNSEELRERVEELIEEFDAKVLYIETNQGGDLWRQVFSGIKAKYREVHQRINKEVRAGQAHDFYKKKKVYHTRHFPTLEEQMLAFPNVPHDDVVDAMVSAVLYFNKPNGAVKITSTNYLEG